MNICSFDVNRQSEELPGMEDFEAEEQMKAEERQSEVQVDGPNEWFCEKDGWN